MVSGAVGGLVGGCPFGVVGTHGLIIKFGKKGWLLVVEHSRFGRSPSYLERRRVVDRMLGLVRVRVSISAEDLGDQFQKLEGGVCPPPPKRGW